MRLKLLTLSFCLLSPISVIAAEKPPAPLFDNLGKFHHPINTNKPLAQRYFDQGLVLLYSFEYGEAIRSFEAATKVDPDCAMCYWGLALSLGSKTDMPLNGHELPDAKKAIQTAMQKVKKENQTERFYIAALAQRYTNISPQQSDAFAGLCSSYSAVSGNKAKKYSQAMQRLTALLPNDADAKTLYAASMFDVLEWNFWNPQGKANSGTLKTIETLEDAMKIDPDHPGANHLYVHIIEGSSQPTKSLPNAERLSKLVPESEHLAHMPCHAYYSVGRYHDAVLANLLAIKRAENYAALCKAQGFKPEVQYLDYHNYDYLVAAASMEGNKKLSISTADKLATLVLPLAEQDPILQKMLTDSILMRVQFGEWNEVLKMPPPDAKFAYAVAIWHYARGVAAVELKKLTEAKKELADLQQIIQQGQQDKTLGDVGFKLMQIAHDILAGMILNQSGQSAQAEVSFIHSIQLQDTFYSSDPPPWYFPVRQLLGNFYLAKKQYADASAVFMDDLKKHPQNGWSLYGLYLSLKGVGKEQEAKIVEEKYKQAWQFADISEPNGLGF